MARAIPTINTARLTLRAMRPEDFDRFAEIWSDSDVVAQIGIPAWSRGQAWASFLRNAGHWQVTGFGQWAIEDRANGRMIGQTGFFYAKAGLSEEFDRVPEAGWVLAPEAQGRGLGREATTAAHDWFDRVITGPLVARIAPKNAASRGLAALLGYHETEVAQDGASPVQLLRRSGPPPAI